MNFFQFALAIVLFICLADKPAHFYTYVHAVSSIILALMAFNAYTEDKYKTMCIYCILALFFQPLFPAPLDRSVWNIFEVSLGLTLIFFAFRPARQ